MTTGVLLVTLPRVVNLSRVVTIKSEICPIRPKKRYVAGKLGSNGHYRVVIVVTGHSSES